MNKNQLKKYIAYIGRPYNEKSLNKIYNSTNLYNKKNNSGIKLIVSDMPSKVCQNYKNIINIGYRNLLDSEYFPYLQAVLVDESEIMIINEILLYMSKGILVLSHEKNRELINLFVSESCGLFYSNPDEFLGLLEYILDEKNKHIVDIIKNNGIQSANSILARCYDIERLKDIVKKKNDAIQNWIADNKNCGLLPIDKVNQLSQQVMKEKDRLVLVCPDEITKCNRLSDVLLIYHYIKLFVNPDAEIFFSGKVKINDWYYKLLKAEIHELAIRDVYFGVAEENQEGAKIVITSCYDERYQYAVQKFDFVISLKAGKEENVIYVNGMDTEYIGELIGSLLYDKGGEN